MSLSLSLVRHSPEHVFSWLESNLEHCKRRRDSPRTRQHFPLHIDPFMQSRGAPSNFANLKEEPLRASWPAMLVDPSWYVALSLVAIQNPLVMLSTVISIQPSAWPRLTSKSSRRTICARATSSTSPWHSTIEAASRLKSNGRLSWVSSRRKW